MYPGKGRKCVICKKQEGKIYSEQQTAGLPDFRVREAPAISKVGVDFAGPLSFKAQTGGGEGGEKGEHSIVFLLRN